MFTHEHNGSKEPYIMNVHYNYISLQLTDFLLSYQKFTISLIISIGMYNRNGTQLKEILLLKSVGNSNNTTSFTVNVPVALSWSGVIYVISNHDLN